ncbi:hypothetical protein JCM10450v2_006007 [Rhodotorula kratochvilovae]
MAAAAAYAPAPAHTLYSAASAPPAPRTSLPPLASLSLPGSPTADPAPSFRPVRQHTASPTVPIPTAPALHHPRPTYPRATPPPLLAPASPPHPPAPAPTATAPDVYARAYSLLRERLAGCGDDVVRSAAAQARGALEARRRSLEEVGQGGEGERAGKRRRTSANSVDFYDNPPPCPAPVVAAEEERGGKALPSLKSVLPSEAYLRLPSLSSTTTAPYPTSSAAAASRPGMARKRSFSLPPGPAPPPSHARPLAPRSTPPSPPLLSSSLPASRSLPSLALPSSGRAEALRGVVASFEAVRAVRAEGWARLARVGAGTRWEEAGR